MSELQKARAVIYGLALGDALGWPVEFLKMRKIHILYGEEGIKEPPEPALFTDETQMTIAVTEALIEAGEASIDRLMQAVTRHLIAWNNSPDNDRAPGHTVTEAIQTLESGISWRQSGSAHAKGNGSVIRVATIGYLYQHDPDRLREVAQAVGMATHSHPTAQASTVAAAYLIKLALDQLPPDAYIPAVTEFLGDVPEELAQAFDKALHVAQWTDEFAALEHLGGGWIAEEAVAMAIYCANRYPDDYVGGVRRAVNIPGDSDSIGSLVGGLTAARMGLSAIPADWIARLDQWDYLTELARRLAAKKTIIYGAI